MASPEQEKRRAAFAALIAEHQESPTDYDEGEEEDPRPYLDGREPLAPWVCVTVNYSSRGHAKTFFLPTFEEPDAAELRAVEFVDDPLFEELPVAVVNLDTGETRTPDYRSIGWKTC